MKVLELLDEIEEIVDTAAGFPLTGKIMVDAEEILEIVKEIRVELPDEIQQAQWIKDERQRILDEAKREYDTVIRDAQKQAEALIENDDITVKAKRRAEEIMSIAEANCKQLKMSTFDYVDSILYNFQNKMEHAVNAGQHAQHDGSDHRPAPESPAVRHHPSEKDDQAPRTDHAETRLQYIVYRIDNAKYLFRHLLSPFLQENPNTSLIII